MYKKASKSTARRKGMDMRNRKMERNTSDNSKQEKETDKEY